MRTLLSKSRCDVRTLFHNPRLTAVAILSLTLGCAFAQNKRTVIAASMALDGKGHILQNTRIVIDGSTISDIEAKAGPVDYDLRGLTVLPGWIDAHVHIDWYFGGGGKFAGGGGGTPEAAFYAASNGWLTLMAGFTTGQTMGPSETLRNIIASGLLPGPRILAALEPLAGRGEQTGTLEEIRAHVRKQNVAGADLLKIYASGGMRQGGMTLSQEQLSAACDEAKRHGLRTLVHAYRDAVRAAIVAGCTEVEHGLGATDEDLKLMAERGIFFDPQAGLLLETYLGNKNSTPAPSTRQQMTGSRSSERSCQ
jgi:imidazolonepropionase-like amidohydrolase